MLTTCAVSQEAGCRRVVIGSEGKSKKLRQALFGNNSCQQTLAGSFFQEQICVIKVWTCTADDSMLVTKGPRIPDRSPCEGFPACGKIEVGRIVTIKRVEPLQFPSPAVRISFQRHQRASIYCMPLQLHHSLLAKLFECDTLEKLSHFVKFLPRTRTK